MRNILLVDDDEQMASAVQVKLSPLGQVFYASSIEAAREVIGRIRFDLFLLDLHLPDGRGDELISLTDGAVVVLVTGDIDGQAIADESGVRVLMKPVNPANLVALVEQVVPKAFLADVDAWNERLHGLAGELTSLLTRVRRAQLKVRSHGSGGSKQVPNLRVLKGGKSGE